MYGPHARFRPHTPARPSFRCRTCGAGWPCQPARLGLLRAYRDNRIGLLVYLAGQLQRALQDLPTTDPRELATRIVYWLPRSRPR
ncbi:flavin reductase [Plantactinospora sp. DSM 117369]